MSMPGTVLHRVVALPARSMRRLLGPPPGEPPSATPVDGGAMAAVADPWMVPSVLEHPDGHLRHRRLASAIRSRHQGGTLLSVGDPFCQMHDLLPEFEVTSTDLGEAMWQPEGARFVRTDFTSPGVFPGAPFDLVCSMDTLEHVPAAARRPFLEAAVGIARHRTYLAFPSGVCAAEAEALIRATHSRMVFRDALEEHAEHGLPELPEVEAILDELGCEHAVRPLTSVTEWLTSFLLCPGDWEQPDVVLASWEFLNRTAAASPGSGPVYRWLVEAWT